MQDMLGNLGNYLEEPRPTNSYYENQKTYKRVKFDSPAHARMWKELISDILQVEGYTVERIAQTLDISRDTIQRMMREGTMEPRYVIAARLFALHLILRPDRYGQLPINLKKIPRARYFTRRDFHYIQGD